MLKNISISGKIVSVVVMLSVVAFLSAMTGVVGLLQLSHGTEQIHQAADNVTLSAAMTESLLLINRAEYRLGIAPEDVREVKQIVAKQTEVFNQATAQLLESLDGDRKSKVDVIVEDFAAYQKAADVTIAAAERARNVAMGSSTGDIIKQLKISVGMVFTLSEKVRALSSEIAADSSRLSAQIKTRATALIIAALLISLIGIGAGVVVGLLIGKKGLVQPIESIVGVLKELAQGRLDVVISDADRKDEVGDITRAALILRDGAKEAEALRAKQAQEQQKRTEWAAAIETLTRTFDHQAAGVIDAVAQSALTMQATASSMTNYAEETTGRGENAARAADQATSNVQTVAAATEQLSVSIQEISRQMHNATTVSDQAVIEAERTTQIVEGLEHSARKIGEIVSLISDVASQTNLLALNATIEAARAGDAGKGFAVVAGEVKGLANQTARATDEIKAQVSAVQLATGQAVDAIKVISEIIRQISTISLCISDTVVQQGQAATEISVNVVAAVSGTREVNDNIVGVYKSAEDTGAAAHDVLIAATDLTREAELLRGTVGTFLNAVRVQ